MQDGQDDLDLSHTERPEFEQPVDVYDWLDAAIRATVVAQHGFHNAPPTVAEDDEWPEARDLDDVVANDEGPAPFTPASAARVSAAHPGDRRDAVPAAPLRRSLDPVRVPLPRPNPRQRRSSSPLLLYGPMIGGAAIVAYGITVWGSPPSWRSVNAAADARPIVVDAQSEADLAPRLIVHDQHVLTNEPLPLDVTVDKSVANASLRVAGLASGTHLSAGAAVGDSGWDVPLSGLKNLFMYAPTDFVGVMNSAVDLRGADQRLIDRRKVKLEWIEPKKDVAPISVPKAVANPPVQTAVPVPAPVSPPAMSAEVSASLMQRGQDYLKNGDIASARIVFNRLAAAGVADGAFAAGETYDSAYLATHNVFGVGGDEAKAQGYYQRAVQLGSSEAAAHLAGAVAK
jgi:hypothetical protein